MLYFYSYRIKIVCPRRPVISAVYCAEENDERAEDRSSLPEPIFYGGTLPTFSRVSLSGFISRARTLSLSLSRVYSCTRILGRRAQYTRGGKGYTARSRSRWKNGRFHMNAFHANVLSTVGNGGEGRERRNGRNGRSFERGEAFEWAVVGDRSGSGGRFGTPMRR